LQKTRTKADCARGLSEVNINLENFYGPAYGPLTKAEVAKWSPIFDEFSSLAWPLIKSAKDRWQRPRPFVAHSDIIPCVKLEKSFSYPSGHAAMAYYYLEILEQLKPSLTNSLTLRAEQIAHDRNLVGVHYPSDVRDGKILGDEIYDFRKDEPKFEALLAHAKALH
jgi:acid phosphatase (class A)